MYCFSFLHSLLLCFSVALLTNNQLITTLSNLNNRIDTEYWQMVWNNFKAGDRDAFQTIYNEFVDALFSYGHKITSDRDLVKDSIQDLFIDVYTYGSKLNKPESLEFYLYKTLKRIIIRKLIEQKKHTSVEELKNLFELEFYSDEVASNGEQEEQFTELKKELSNLTPSKRELLFLKFNSGLTYEEIGKILDVKPNTVKKQVYRLLDQLRKNIEPKVLVLFLMC